MTVVNGLRVPAHLDELIAWKRWAPTSRPSGASALPLSDPEDLALLDVAQMEANTAELASMVANGTGAVLGLTGDEQPQTGWLAVDSAVVIAATYGEEGLALDYSRPGEPRVVATHVTDEGVRWVEVAETFADLVVLLGLAD